MQSLSPPAEGMKRPSHARPDISDMSLSKLLRMDNVRWVLIRAFYRVILRRRSMSYGIIYSRA